jgi:hypothetical protein
MQVARELPQVLKRQPKAREVFMANESELFYLVLLTLLTLVVHVILSTKNRRDNRHSHP